MMSAKPVWFRGADKHAGLSLQATRVLAAAFVALVTGCHPAAQPKCLLLGSAGAAVTGTLEEHSFPGPPNYENMATGDAEERGFYLKLAAPNCARASVD